MTWPSKIYVATTALGIYYTDNFSSPAVQPIWTTINTGLSDLDIFDFGLDPFHNEDRQYALTWTNHILYRRELGGNWTSILTPAQVDALVGGSGAIIYSFHSDVSIDGTIWVIAGSGTNGGYYTIFSTDYGANWTARKSYDAGTCCQCGQIRAYGNNIWYWRSSGAGCESKVHYSSNGGNPWNKGGDIVYYFDSNDPLELNPLIPTKVYLPNGNDLVSLTNTGVSTGLQSHIAPHNHGGMWFDPVTANHQRILDSYLSTNNLRITTDDWANYSTVNLDLPARYFSIYSGNNNNQMIVGCVNHDVTVGTLDDEADITVTNISGTNYATPPYTDAIPKAAEICRNGLWAVKGNPGSVYTYAVAMPGYSGDDRGIPMEGERSAWDALNYPDRHTNDIDTGIHHAFDVTDWTPSLAQSGAVTKTVNYAKYVLIGNLCWICGSITCTGAGGGNTDIIIGNLPKTPAANGVYGSGWINDDGTGFYSGPLVYINTNGGFTIRAHLETDDVGSDPAFTLANNDAIMFFAIFPWA
jgi:hypothetical protein